MVEKCGGPLLNGIVSVEPMWLFWFIISSGTMLLDYLDKIKTFNNGKPTDVLIFITVNFHILAFLKTKSL